MKAKIADLKVSFFVRVHINRDRVKFFLDRLRAGETLEDVLVDQDTNELIDGRTRMQALQEYGSSDIGVRYQKFALREDQVAAAVRANSGPSPSTNEDIEHVISYLLRLHLSRKKINDLLATAMNVSSEFIRNATLRVVAKLKKIQVRKAVDAVGIGDKTIDQVAGEFGLSAEDIKREMGLSDTKTNKNKVTEITMTVNNSLNSTSSKIGANLLYVQRLVESGEIGLNDATDMVHMVQKKLKTLIKNNEGWEKRFKQVASTPNIAMALAKEKARKAKARSTGTSSEG